MSKKLRSDINCPYCKAANTVDYFKPSTLQAVTWKHFCVHCKNEMKFYVSRARGKDAVPGALIFRIDVKNMGKGLVADVRRKWLQMMGHK